MGSKNIKPKLVLKEKDPKITILIPARNESSVIEDLLNSIENQTKKVSMQDVYVIVEDEKDKTVSIVKKHHASVFVRQRLDKKTKGFALEEMIEELEKEKKYYDCYFIFDADNILDKHFIENMLKDYQKGYLVSTGYRALKNKNHYFPVSAGLTYYAVNELRNKFSLKYEKSLLLSGTGYYIDGSLIRKWKTFPFHSLTEDYESSLYYARNEVSTHYNTSAIFYDEQPKNYKTSIIQRSRWIKGYLNNWISFRKEMRKKKKNPSVLQFYIGILPLICFVLGILFLLFAFIKDITQLFLMLFLIYFILLLFTFILLCISNLNLNKKLFLQVLFYHPIFMLSYIHALLVSFFHKNLGWEVVKHGK